MEAGVLEFRSLGDLGRFAEWVRALRGVSGVYVIRDLSGTVLYVGESHRDKLYETLTRHLQAWSGRTAGPTYHRERVEVAVAVVPRAEALVLQDALIVALQPEDNRRIPPWQSFQGGGDQGSGREVGTDDGGEAEDNAVSEVPF